MSERLVLRPGALVVGPDESLGWIDALYALPGSRRISGFALRDGLMLNRGAVVPIDAVEQTDDSRIHVRLTADQLTSLADAQLRDAGQPREERSIEARRRIVSQDGDVGRLLLVLAEASSHRITHLVVDCDDSPGRNTLVPAEWVREVTDDPIVLDVRNDEVASLPEYRPDDEITDAASSMLWYRSNISPADLRHVVVETRDGIVNLSGKTRTEESRMAIEALVRPVSGVLGVRNEIRTFEALSAAAQSYRQRAETTARPMSDTSAPPHHASIDHGVDGSGSAPDGSAGSDVAASESEPGASGARPLTSVA